MAGNLAAIKAKARRDIHRAMSVAATHTSVSLGVVTPISVRWHNRMVLLGDLQDSGYANVIDGIERIIFERNELAQLGITLRPADVITITAEGYQNAQLVLGNQEPIVGPFQVTWQVARK